MTQKLRSRAPLPLLALAALAALLALPAAADSNVTTDAWLPAVHIVGANGTYLTDVSVFNPSNTTTADVRFAFTPADTDGTHAEPIHLTNGLAPRASVTLADILHDYFGVSSGYGTMNVYTMNEPAVGVIVTSNTYNIAGAAPGTFGQFSPGQPERNSAGFGRSSDYNLYVTGIPHDGDHVTNAVVMNPSKYTLYATLELVDANGGFWGDVQHITVPPYSMHQLNDVFRNAFGSLNPSYDNAWRLNFYVDTNTGATVLGYATVQDRRSGDPYLVPAAAEVVNVPAAAPAPLGAVRAPAPLRGVAQPLAPAGPIQVSPVRRRE